MSFGSFCSRLRSTRWLPQLRSVVAGAIAVAVSVELAAQQPDRVIPRRSFQIGAGVSPDSVAFGEVAWLVPRSDGGAYAYDARARRVFRISTAGKLLHSMGRAGKGNGAYGELAGGATIGDSLLALWDPTNQRVVVLHESGEFRRNVPVPMAGRGFVSHSSVTEFSSDSNGLLYLHIQNGMGSDRFSWLRVNADGTIVDSIADSRRRAERRFTSDGFRMTFAPETLRVPHRLGGVLVGDPSTYRISLSPGNGSQALVAHEWNPVQVVPGERAEWLSYINRGTPLAAAAVGALLPVNKTAFRTLMSDDAGNIWVEVNSLARADSSAKDALTSRPTSIWRDPTRYDVFNARGQFQRQVELPRNTYALGVSGRRMWLREYVDGKPIVGVYEY